MNVCRHVVCPQEPGASCNFVLSLHTPQGAKAGIPVNFRHFKVDFLCVDFKEKTTAPCLSSQHLTVLFLGYPAHVRKTKPDDHFRNHCWLSPMACNQQQSCGLVPAFHLFACSAASLTPFKGIKSDSQKKSLSFCIQDVSHEAGGIFLQAAR